MFVSKYEDEIMKIKFLYSYFIFVLVLTFLVGYPIKAQVTCPDVIYNIMRLNFNKNVLIK